jgi:NAD(P)-dependent dehydrogenase (short-subunit alcohol dehydrogenase family)
VSSAARSAAQPGDLVLVTSVVSPLGYTTAQFLASRGLKIVGGMPPGRREVVADLSIDSIGLDIEDSASIAAVVASLKERGSRPLFGLVNTASLPSHTMFEEMSDADLRRLIDVNVFATMAITRAVLPTMRAAGRGRIVSLGSASGRRGSSGLAGYGLTMQALVGWHEALALELMPFLMAASVVEAGVEPAEAEPVRPAVAQAVFHALTDTRPRFRYPASGISARASRPRSVSAATMSSNVNV